MSRLTIALTAVSGVLGLALYVAYLQLSVARADLVAAQQTIEAHIEAATKLDDHLRRQAEDAAKWRRITDETDRIGGADEPLNAYERAVLDRVRD